MFLECECSMDSESTIACSPRPRSVSGKASTPDRRAHWRRRLLNSALGKFGCIALLLLMFLFLCATIEPVHAADQGHAYLQCLAEGSAAEAAIGPNYRPTLGHRCVLLSGGYRCEVLANGGTAWSQWLWCSYAGLVDWFPIEGTCSARPNLDTESGGTAIGSLLCNQGCEYGSLDAESFQPSGRVCPAGDSELDPGKNNCCEATSG